MKKILVIVGLVSCLQAGAQDIASIIKEAVTKVIRAVDLEIQRIQTETIVLQEAQKEVENAMSALRLDQIKGWVEEQKDLYAEYFQELEQVKTVISDYHKVSGVVRQEENILSTYRRALALLGQDPHFSPSELNEMSTVFGALLSESEKNLEIVVNVTGGLIFQMTDEQRMAAIDGASTGMDKDYRDMQVYMEQNELISLQRARDESDYATLKKLYGL